MSRLPRRQRIGAHRTTAILVGLVAVLSTLVSAMPSGAAAHPVAHARARAVLQEFPVGTTDPADPSGMGPPGPNAFPGYVETYSTDFSGTVLPPGWEVFTGAASGDPGSQWGAAHVSVDGGVLSLTAYQDAAYGNEWVTGGLCLCGAGQAHTYGAYFVRSRVTGAGPTLVELLWPAVGWPPEIDFNETSGVTTGATATVHWTPANLQQQLAIRVDETQWHTWGVIWTPTSILYTIDGRVWGEITNPVEVPTVPMTLHIQQQTWCSSGFACPTSDQSTQVDWVAEYEAAPSQPMDVGLFARGSSYPTTAIRTQVEQLAERVRAQGVRLVSLTGYGDAPSSSLRTQVVGRARALAVRSLLVHDLAQLHDPGVIVTVANVVRAQSVASTVVAASRMLYRRVVAHIG